MPNTQSLKNLLHVHADSLNLFSCSGHSVTWHLLFLFNRITWSVFLTSFQSGLLGNIYSHVYSICEICQITVEKLTGQDLLLKIKIGFFFCFCSYFCLKISDEKICLFMLYKGTELITEHLCAALPLLVYSVIQQGVWFESIIVITATFKSTLI